MKAGLEKIDLSSIEITDSFFKTYVDNVSTKIIPHQWKILNDQLEDGDPTYCIENFRIAAGEKKGSRKGVVFQDTDAYKWLEAVAYCIAGGKGKEYESVADELIELIGRAQEEDGYLNTYFSVNEPNKKWTNLVEGHELYTSGHMIEAAVAYYQATKKDKFLKIAIKNAELICKIFGTGTNQIKGYPGHQEIELALVKLYRITGKQEFLEEADYFIRERGKKPSYFEEEMEKRGGYEFFPEFKNYDLEYSQSQEEPINQKDAEGHAVRAMYMSAAMADLAREYDDEKMLDACKRIWSSAVERRMYITGGIGSSGFRERFTTDFDLPNSTNYSETCASVGLMMFGQRMTAVTGDAAYYDVVEKALYNTVLAGINLAGDRYFYVNPLEVVPEFCTEHTYMDHVKAERQKWFSVACCPPNVARTLASLGQYIYAADEKALYIHQYISSRVDTRIGTSDIQLNMESKLLENGTVSLHIVADQCVELKLRIPQYAGKWKLCIDKKEHHLKPQQGYAVVELCSGEYDIDLDFDIEPVWMGAKDEVREDAGKAALMKGPLVYCLEEVDNGRFLADVYVDEETRVEETEPVKGFSGEVPTLSYKGTRICNKGVSEHKLYGNLNLEREQVMLKAVPYCFWNNRGKGEMEVWQKVRI